MVQISAFITTVLIGSLFIGLLVRTTYREIDNSLEIFARQEAASVNKEITFRLEQLAIWGQSNSLQAAKNEEEWEGLQSLLKIFAKNKKFCNG